jgi:signal transduction histidine kinase
MIPSLFPLYDPASGKLRDGGVIPVCSFCKKAISAKSQCKQNYAALASKPEGFYQCPSGFTSYVFYFGGQMWVVTGVIAFPRFGDQQERGMAKRYPETKVAREEIRLFRTLFSDIQAVQADTVQKAAQVFPQAFHELRKLNAAILQHAEKELRDHGGNGALQTIQSAAELMRNNFDILEALSNIEGMRAVPLDATINVYDLLYKTRCIYLERATSRRMELSVTGVRAIVRGSRKSFPIVPAVMLENAIKYGRRGTTVRASVAGNGSVMLLIVENETDYTIDPETCFNRGSRFAGDSVEGGGFGLFLAKEIVLAHKGEIWCEKAGVTVRMLVKMPIEKVIA